MNYRADIDGIRAIAVSTVILFHFGVAGFAGGFIGVDVFFVLSGYLISSIIFAQLEKGKFEFSTFYFRRIRRLFPVYLVVMLVTFALCYAYMLPRDFREFGQSLLASTVYISNVLFYLEAGYFDTSSHLKPLLHTWSLSVEEQFYVVFPLLAFICARFSRTALFYIFGVLTVASFLAAALYIEKDTSAVFYLYPFRAWEMFLGTLLATNYLPQVKSRQVCNTIALVGLVLIVYPTFTYDETTLFPGISALAPCLGTCMLIYSGSSHLGWVHDILSTKLPVAIGKLSYSLYLWHWPVYVIYAYNKPDGTDGLDAAIMAAVTIGASILCYYFVETPFRHGRVVLSKTKTGVFASCAALSFVFMATGLYIHKTNGMPQRLDTKTAAFAVAAGDLFGDLTGCEEEDNSTLEDIAYCTIGNPFNADSYTLIWGDSHGGAYKRGYTSLVEGQNQDALIAWTGGCPPVYGLHKDESVSSKAIDDRCPVRNEAIRTLIEKDKDRINAIVLVGRWSYYLNGGGVGVDSHNKIRIWSEDSPKVDNEQQYFTDAFIETAKGLKDQGFKVFVVEQPPEFSQFRARRLAIGLMNGSSDFDQDIKSLTVESYAQVLERQGAMQAALKQAQEDDVLTILTTHNFFCRDENCSLMFGEAPSYFDNNHVSSFGAEQINTMFKPVLDYVKQSNVSSGSAM